MTNERSMRVVCALLFSLACFGVARAIETERSNHRGTLRSSAEKAHRQWAEIASESESLVRTYAAIDSTANPHWTSSQEKSFNNSRRFVALLLPDYVAWRNRVMKESKLAQADRDIRRGLAGSKTHSSQAKKYIERARKTHAEVDTYHRTHLQLKANLKQMETLKRL